ncbi:MULTISPECIES: NAD(P)H-dependent flavin oxidoreductase [Vitreoscilla]|uniref:Propionate 3-nitronate monooxygenase n=1 Tax=Vitreoscilla stercoraria TaxID=61 RepID=A0ABY4EEG1_VITST|nr:MULTISPECIES: nitronate monooxygenase [Vitreoscilla]AUZ05358.2 nitronate monooxygenase [Vitreoscilla sp. C1]UOO93330.1 nitronate monooxygenase [Vitreoscilla stercoraria]
MRHLFDLPLHYPIIQAPMAGGASSPQLVAAACEAGALGSLACGILSPEQMVQQAQHIRTLTQHAFAMNLFILPEPTPPSAPSLQAAKLWLEPAFNQLGLDFPTVPTWSQSFHAQFETLLQLQPAIASFAFGILTSAQAQALQQKNIRIIGTANSPAHLQAWLDVGADAVVLQGIEAGGHRGGPTELAIEDEYHNLDLLQACRAITDKPLISAGGISQAQQVQDYLAHGADAVQIGTAFLCATESGASSVMKQALWDKRHQKTRLTRLFSGKNARGIENTWMQTLAAYEQDALPYPYQNALTSPMRAWADRHQQAEYLSLWAGTGVAHMRQQSVAEILQYLYSDMDIDCA